MYLFNLPIRFNTMSQANCRGVAMGSRLGVLKVAAKKAGVSFEEYQNKVANGEKWCSLCKAFHPFDSFGIDLNRGDGRSSSCLNSRRSFQRKRYQKVPLEDRKTPGPSPHKPRSGDKKQARQRINVEVRTGKRPHPNFLPCVDCGHVYTDGERRHEYDHYKGYSAEHHYDVEPVCTICHSIRTRGVHRPQDGMTNENYQRVM